MGWRGRPDPCLLLQKESVQERGYQICREEQVTSTTANACERHRGCGLAQSKSSFNQTSSRLGISRQRNDSVVPRRSDRLLAAKTNMRVNKPEKTVTKRC